ncbi:MAG: hypothetical protein OEL77_04230 [Nitrosopumilus sp.]|nr:hypothetical protein [Nitrosopumilus sp.]MDH3385205.1 hypothetical protein [Nitrosopumilus sp.]
MSTTLEVSTKNYRDDSLAVKMALSHIETLVGSVNGYSLSEPHSKFGWTFFKIAMKPDLQDGIEKKFADMIEKYRWSNPSEKFTKFMTDYFKSKGCDIKIKLVDS